MAKLCGSYQIRKLFTSLTPLQFKTLPIGCGQVLENIELNKKSLYSRVPGCQITTYYYVGYVSQCWTAGDGVNKNTIQSPNQQYAESGETQRKFLYY